MSALIEDATGLALLAYLRRGQIAGEAVVDLMIAAPDPAALETFAAETGLRAMGEDGVPRDAPHVVSDIIGPVETAAAVYDGDGVTLLTPAVYDPACHANFRICPAAEASGGVALPAWQQAVVDWMRLGTLVTSAGGAVAMVHRDIRLIDPDSIATPARVWLAA
ncbi:hypothetical protein [Pseudodonghicola flavimaris]|uniref:Uncharacterized protein n=1 Tax=Pseudodonghicola flavimaris TaxID=3050036 RepID=A0ABT7F6A8_9RHOB|nr:hypothetical protein [Pseudodonghicola flavimaris]MDK3020137.1 hypothetical protein [Pseudodonghicola flavimaris]